MLIDHRRLLCQVDPSHKVELDPLGEFLQTRCLTCGRGGEVVEVIPEPPCGCPVYSNGFVRHAAYCKML